MSDFKFDESQADILDYDFQKRYHELNGVNVGEPGGKHETNLENWKDDPNDPYYTME